MRKKSLIAALVAVALATPALAAPVLMTGDWGKGEYGPMAAMMFGRLGFDGPMLEAMGNMGPFESFLLLVGKVPSETGSCPAK